MIHGYGSTMDQPWINMDQRGSTALQPARRGSCVRKNMYPKSRFRVHIILAHAFSLPAVAHASHVLDSCVMTHGSCVMRPTPWLMRHASHAVAHASCVHVSRVMCHESRMSPFSVPRPGLMRHGSRLMRPRLTCQASHAVAHASCVMDHVSCVHVSCVPRRGSCVMRPRVMRPTHVAGIQPRSAPFIRRPLSVMTTTGTAVIYPC